MPRRKRVKRTVTEEELPEEETPDFQEVGVEDVPPGLEHVMAELGEEVTKVTVWRRQAGKKEAWLASYDAADFTVEEVAHRFGGGHYIARFADTEGKWLRGWTFYVDESVKPEPRPAPGTVDPASAPPWMDRLLDRVLSAPANQKDPMEIAAALASASALQVKNSMDMLLPLIDKLLSGSKHDTPMNDLMAAIELGTTMGGEKDSYLPVIREVGAPLVRALETYLQTQRALPAGNPPVADALAQAPAVPRRTWWDVLMVWVPKVVDAAVQGVDVDPVAALVYNNAPGLARWLEMKMAGDAAGFEAALLERFPTLAPHAEWTHDLLEEFAPEPEPEEEEPHGHEEGEGNAGEAGVS